MTVARKVGPNFPRGVERRMAADGLRVVRRIRALIEKPILRALRTGRLDEEGEDRPDVLAEQLMRYLAISSVVLGEDEVVSAQRFGRYGRIVYQQAAGETSRILQQPRIAAVDPTRGQAGVIETWAAEAEARIVLIEETYREKVRAIIIEGYELGQSQATIAARIEQAGAATENRARLWARDQIATINAQAHQTAHARAGVTHYRWRTSRDERVRDRDRPGDNHREREGVIYAWARPPEENAHDGHPGQPINCRCTAEPIPPDELEAALAEQRLRGDLPPYASR